jgi:Bacterial mobilisation protein (MobC)
MATLDKILTIRLTLEAHNLLGDVAKTHGMIESVYARRIILQAINSKMQEPPVRRRVLVREELRRLLGELGKQGSNLNQLARHCNSASTAPQLDVLRRMEAEQARLILAICGYLGLGDAP